jgi:hypothetical protein
VAKLIPWLELISEYQRKSASKYLIKKSGDNIPKMKKVKFACLDIIEVGG